MNESDKLSVTDYILTDDLDLDQYSGVMIGLSVVTAKLKQLFKFRHIPLVLSDNWQGALTKSYGISDNVEKKLPVPYCYLKISSLGVRDDAHNLNQTLRNGTSFSYRGEDSGDLSNALLTMHYHAWAKFNIELCVGFRDPVAFFSFCEKLSIAIRARRISSLAQYEDYQFSVWVDPSQSEISPNPMTTDDGATAGWLTLNQQMTVFTQFGASQAAAKLNNEGNITTNVEVQRG